MTCDYNYISSELRSLIEPAMQKSHSFHDTLSFKEYSNAYIAPYYGWEESVGCVLDCHGNSLGESSFPEWKENGYYYNVQEARAENKTVIYLGFLLTVFGHAFNDNFRAIWFLHTNDFKHYREQGAELVYTTSHNKPLSDAIIKAFDMAGIDIRAARQIKTLTRFDKVIIPDSSIKSSCYGRLYHAEFCSIINLIKSSFSSLSSNPLYDKIYFTRTRLKGYKDIGEERIEKLFKRKGYTIIAPEHLSIEEQITIIMSCSCFATTEGSISHLSIFCRPGTKVILVNKANYLNYHQVMINEFADLDVTYIEAHHSSRANPSYPWWGPFYLFPTSFCKDYFNTITPILPYWLHLDYWIYYLGKSETGKNIVDTFHKLMNKLRH